MYPIRLIRCQHFELLSLSHLRRCSIKLRTMSLSRPVSPVRGQTKGASDCRDWLSTMDILSDSHTFYAPDLIGYGQSDKSKDGYYLSDFVDFTMQFTEVLGLRSSSLVGHSLGGRVCLEIALRYPKGPQAGAHQCGSFQQAGPLGSLPRNPILGSTKFVATSTALPQVLEREWRLRQLDMSAPTVYPQGAHPDRLEPS